MIEDEYRKTRHCHICNKEITVHGEWGYTHGKYYFCTYSHMREYERSKKDVRTGPPSIVFCVCNGEKMRLPDVIDKYNLSSSHLYKLMRAGRTYKNIKNGITVEPYRN